MDNKNHLTITMEKFTNIDTLDNLMQKYHCPSDLTSGVTTPMVFPRSYSFEQEHDSTVYGINACNIVIDDIATKVHLEPLMIVINNQEVVFIVEDGSQSINDIQKLINPLPFEDAPALVACLLSKIYSNYRLKLSQIKEAMDDLEEQAQQTTKNKNLIKIKDLEQAVVTLQHTLDSQHHALQTLFEFPIFSDDTSNEKEIYNIQIVEKQITDLIDLYRDLIDAIGGLFSDMMSNNLNHLMKFLDSAALIVSVPSLIAGLWGMNTGGLPGKSSTFGFWMMILVSAASALIMWVILRFKKYND